MLDSLDETQLYNISKILDTQ
jgi:hypothetical protein